MKLIEIKSSIHKYSKDQIEQVFDLLNKKTDIKTISDVSKLSKRQIKKLRYINNKANQKEKSMLLECKYLISSIERNIKIRIKNQKKERFNETGRV